MVQQAFSFSRKNRNGGKNSENQTPRWNTCINGIKLSFQRAILQNGATNCFRYYHRYKTRLLLIKIKSIRHISLQSWIRLSFTDSGIFALAFFILLPFRFHQPWIAWNMTNTLSSLYNWFKMVHFTKFSDTWMEIKNAIVFYSWIFIIRKYNTFGQ